MQNNVAAITKSRIPKVFARLQHSRQTRDILPFQAYAARNGLFAKFETLIEELIETNPLLSEHLCANCSKYNWTIAPGADDLRVNALQQRYQRKDLVTRPQHGNHSAVEGGSDGEAEPEPVWLADILPSGSLFDLLTRPECRICMLVLHLLSPLPIKPLLTWALDQPLSVLQGYLYSMKYDKDEAIMVKTKQPLSDVWQEAGSIEMMKRNRENTDEQSLVWASSNLSRRKLLNSSWVQTTDIDYPLVRYWLRRCNEYHEHCHINRSHGRKDMEIRLIDVVDECVVPGTLAHRYFALSYVWGGIARLRATKDNIASLERKHSLQARSGSLPRTVRDAMTFVANLEQRYLWVDSLCIVQDDQNEKHSQISNMHEIYSAAYATIVQHSGCDANAGLPGVRPGSRSLLATKTHVGNAIIMAKANYETPKVLSSSVHSTRGWTHQEVILSNRCLHFFNKHLTFVCGEEWAQDWNTEYKDQDPSTEVAHTDLTQVSAHMLWQMNPLSFARVASGRGFAWWDAETLEWLQYFEIYARIVAEFTTRELSFEADTLPAFYGLAGAITRVNRANFHFGLPSNAIDLALLWINLDSGEQRQCDEDQRTPSWSWAAWKGQTTFNFSNSKGEPSIPYRINSFVRHFYVVENGRSIEIGRLGVDKIQPSPTDDATPYYRAREGSSEPSVDPVKANRLPHGCLHFWAEEAPMDQFIISQSQSTHFLHARTSEFRCGVLALPRNLHSLDMLASLNTPTYSLVLMSESHRVLSDWTFGPKGTQAKTRMAFANVRLGHYEFPETYSDGESRHDSWMFNVLLVKRTGVFVERVAFGQIHMLAWLDLQRARRYIRMI